ATSAVPPTIHAGRRLDDWDDDTSDDMSDDDTGSTSYDYVGCFKNDPERSLLAFGFISADTTTERCHTHCTNEGATFMGLQYGSLCWCGFGEQGLYTGLGEGHCGYDCYGDGGEYCGGRHAFDLYYLGDGPAAMSPSPTAFSSTESFIAPPTTAAPATSTPVTAPPAGATAFPVSSPRTKKSAVPPAASSAAAPDVPSQASQTSAPMSAALRESLPRDYCAAAPERPHASTTVHFDGLTPTTAPFTEEPTGMDPTPATAMPAAAMPATAEPFMARTPTPVTTPTAEPAAAPTARPVTPPTPKPVAAPTPAPVQPPTPQPAAAPAAKPVAAPTPAQGSPTPSDMVDLLALHNEARCIHNASPLTWSSTVASSAAVHAAKLTKTCGDLYHSTSEERNGYGENLYMCWGSDSCYTPEKAMVGLYKGEIEFDSVTQYGGHATQILWKSTEEVGCIAAECSSGGSPHTFLVCQYNPP
ncbi:unnamed protein product, partial [Pylaiella littoralis]